MNTIAQWFALHPWSAIMLGIIALGLVSGSFQKPESEQPEPREEVYRAGRPEGGPEPEDSDEPVSPQWEQDEPMDECFEETDDLEEPV